MSDDRLERVFARSAAPKRDAAYALAVMERAEEDRWRAARRLAALRGIGLGATAAGALVLLGSWGATNPEVFQSALVAVAGLLTTLGAARVLRARLARA